MVQVVADYYERLERFRCGFRAGYEVRGSHVGYGHKQLVEYENQENLVVDPVLVFFTDEYHQHEYGNEYRCHVKVDYIIIHKTDDPW